MTDFEKLTQALIDFRNQRDWEQFHNPKNFKRLSFCLLKF